MMVNKLLEYSPDGILGLSLGYSGALPLAMLCHHLLTDAFFDIYIYYVSDDVTQNINYRRIFKCTFLFCLLICLPYALQGLKALFYKCKLL